MTRDQGEGVRAEVKPDETREMKRTETEKRGMWRENVEKYGGQERGSEVREGRGGKRQKGADNEFRQKEPGHLNYK